MKTGNNKATNNYIIRLWSPKYYKSKDVRQDIKIIDGSITNVNTKKTLFFHSAGDFLYKLEKMQKQAEKERKIKW